VSSFLPDDGFAGTLVARIWLPGKTAGPAVAAIREGGVYELSAEFPTMATLLEMPQPASAVRAAAGRRIGSLEDLLANGAAQARDLARSFLLAPCDLQVIKAAGVTFATSLVERVIEEQADGDATRAREVRARVQAIVGDNLATLKPGSAEAAALKDLLQQQGMWSQYLEVGIGTDAEVFTKAPVLSAVGSGDEVGIRSDSVWNNPEPEVVLAVNSRGDIVGATLGNDVNLRDIEGRSALLLGKAKDNNASCAIGPFIRLFDQTFSLDDVRQETVRMQIDGPEGYQLHGVSSMAQISRDPTDLVAQTMAAHQYPDGFMLFLGTMFAPIDDRDHPGSGFTHKIGDIVRIRSARLGELRNRVVQCERAAPWKFGLRAFIQNLFLRGLLGGAL
jgi:fumarylacetoacetate (FAA) hydrolase family protein